MYLTVLDVHVNHTIHDESEVILNVARLFMNIFTEIHVRYQFNANIEQCDEKL